MKKTVLIFDDQKKHFKTLTDNLKRWGYDPIPTDFSDIEKAINEDKLVAFYAQLFTKNWHQGLRLFICDLWVEKKRHATGINLINAFRTDEKFVVSQFPAFSKLIPIIAYSGVANETQAKDAKIKGADTIIYKIEEKPTLQITKEKNNTALKNFEYDIEILANRFEEQLNILLPYKNDIAKFKTNHHTKNAFIISSYKPDFEKYINTITTCLENNGIDAHLAKDVPGGECSPEKWENMQIYMQACDFGIALVTDDFDFDAKRHNRINPNVTLEIGYMLSLQKKVLLLKESRIRKICSDLDEKLCIEFEDESSLSMQLGQFLKKNRFISLNENI